MRSVPVFLVIVLTLSATLAEGQAVSTLLDLKVLNGSDQARVNEPVSFGIPVALQNQLYNMDFLQVFDPNLQPVPRQFKVLTRWGGVRDDQTKPIRWALVTFNANVPPQSSATYYVGLGGGAVHGDVWASDTLNYIEVHTGPNTYFRVGKTGFKLFEAAVVNGTPLVNPGRIDMFAASGATVTPAITETVLEEYQGYLSVRAVVRQRGLLGGLRFTCRWYFHSGRDDVTVDFRLENANAYGPFAAPNGQVYFDSIYLVQPVLGGGTYTVTTDTATRSLTTSTQLYELQQDYTETAQTDPMDLWTGFGFTETVAGAQVGTGNRFKGSLDFRSSTGGVTLTVDRFWQNFPKGFKAQSGELRIGLFPEWGNGPEYRGQYGDPNALTPPIDPLAVSNYRFEGARWKTHRMVFDFHTGSVTSGAVASEADRVNTPLIGTPPPEWIRYTGATGTLWIERKPTADVAEQRWEKFTDILATDTAADATAGFAMGYPAYIRRGGTYGGHQNYGWENFGDMVWADGYCSQHYDWTQCFMLGFWRTGDYRLFNYGRDVACSRRDYNQNHAMNTNEQWRGGQFYEKGWWHGNYTMGVTSHNWLEGLLMYYVITGDEAAREAAVENVQYMFNNSPKNWSGWYGSRIPGWSIDNLVAAYWYLGNPAYLTEAGLGVYRYELFEQQQGGLGCVLNPANGLTTSWMENIFHIAACKYYMASNDQGVLPLLGRMRDWFKNEICVLPTGTFPNMTLTMVHEYWSPTTPGSLHVHHCWAMSESFAYSAVVFDSLNDLLWSKTYFDGVARYWQQGVNFNNINCMNPATFSPINFHPSQYPGTETKTISNVLRWGTAQVAARALMTGEW